MTKLLRDGSHLFLKSFITFIIIIFLMFSSCRGSFFVTTVVNGVFPTDRCPLEEDNVIKYSIDGYWEGINQSLNRGKNYGTHTITVVFRNSSLLVFFEVKSEQICGIINGSQINYSFSVNSFWSYHPSTRKSVLFKSYSWLWLYNNETTGGSLINKGVKIFNYHFVIVADNEIVVMNQRRYCWVAIYNKTLSDGQSVNNYELWFDKSSGLMVYYRVDYYSFSWTGSIANHSYYSTLLNETDVILDTKFLLDNDTGSTTILFFPLEEVLGMLLVLSVFRFKKKEKNFFVNFFAGS